MKDINNKYDNLFTRPYYIRSEADKISENTTNGLNKIIWAKYGDEHYIGMERLKYLYFNPGSIPFPLKR